MIARVDDIKRAVILLRNFDCFGVTAVVTAHIFLTKKKKHRKTVAKVLIEK